MVGAKLFLFAGARHEHSIVSPLLQIKKWFKQQYSIYYGQSKNEKKQKKIIFSGGRTPDLEQNLFYFGKLE